jgi:hypothetical protein
MKETPIKNPQQKKLYKKPEVKQVPLRPEEAVLGGCKVAATAGPLQAQCDIPTPCPTLVS